MRKASSLVMAGTLLETVVLQRVEAAGGLRPLRPGHADGNDEVAAVGAVEPRGRRDVRGHDICTAQADVRGQLRLLCLVAGPGSDVPRGGKANLSKTLERVDALFARRDLAAKNGVVVDRQLRGIADGGGPRGHVLCG